MSALTSPVTRLRMVAAHLSSSTRACTSASVRSPYFLSVAVSSCRLGFLGCLLGSSFGRVEPD